MKLKLTLFLCLMLCASCSTIYWQQGLDRKRPEFTKKVWRHSYLLGAVNPNTENLSQLCSDSSVETFRTRNDALQVILAVSTLGIYTPYSVAAVCEAQ